MQIDTEKDFFSKELNSNYNSNSNFVGENEIELKNKILSQKTNTNSHLDNKIQNSIEDENRNVCNQFMDVNSKFNHNFCMNLDIVSNSFFKLSELPDLPNLPDNDQNQIFDNLNQTQLSSNILI